MTDLGWYKNPIRDRIRYSFHKRAAAITEQHFGQSASPETKIEMQLILLLLQKVNYLNCQRVEIVKGIYDLHDAVLYEKLRTESGRRAIDEMLTELTSDLQGVLLSLTPNFEVLFQAIYANKDGPIFRIRDVIISPDDELYQFIRGSGDGTQLTAKCMIV